MECGPSRIGLRTGCKPWWPGIGLHVLGPTCSQGPTPATPEPSMKVPTGVQPHAYHHCVLLCFFDMRSRSRGVRHNLRFPPYILCPDIYRRFCTALGFQQGRGKLSFVGSPCFSGSFKVRGCWWCLLVNVTSSLESSETWRSEMCCFVFLLERPGAEAGWIYHCNGSILLLSNVSLNPQSKDNFEVWLCLQCDYMGDSGFPFKSESSSKARESEGLFNYFLICQQYIQPCSEHKDT